MHAYKLYKALGDGAVDSTDRYIFKPRKFRKCSPKNNIYIPVNNKCDFFFYSPSIPELSLPNRIFHLDFSQDETTKNNK